MILALDYPLQLRNIFAESGSVWCLFDMFSLTTSGSLTCGVK
jgi:hypothetical protein